MSQIHLDRFMRYRSSDELDPLFICGNSLDILRHFPDHCIDCIVTSPPYWGQRQYSFSGIGNEPDYRQYMKNISEVCAEIYRVLSDAGSFWLNLGDAYQDKHLLGLPWRVALNLIDNQKWVLRNDVIWNKIKGGPDNAKDKLGNVHEYIFHFVKNAKKYFYNVDAIRSTPKSAKVVNGAVISATGVSGVRYRRQIELSTNLSDGEKRNAMEALEKMLCDVSDGRLADFRMIIRGQQRATHSDSEKISGRARELKERGFYFLRYHPNGSKPRDVWDILPEDTQKRALHFAPYPEDICKIPILATCPDDGIVMDPFCGTGTTNYVAAQFSRKSIGIDCSPEYIELARNRCGFFCNLNSKNG